MRSPCAENIREKGVDVKWNYSAEDAILTKMGLAGGAAFSKECPAGENVQGTRGQNII
jgi:hypothetical protein